MDLKRGIPYLYSFKEHRKYSYLNKDERDGEENTVLEHQKELKWLLWEFHWDSKVRDLLSSDSRSPFLKLVSIGL